MKKIILFTLTALLVSSCLPQDTRIPQSPLLPLLERKSGLIAYMGADGNMYVSDQGGGQLTQLTNDSKVDSNTLFRLYQYPTWSKDGSQLAFVGLSADGNDTEASVFVHNIDEETTTKVYSSPTEYPIYVHWSPNNANISFISTTAAQNNIILQSVPATGGERKVLDVGTPYYWSWAPDGSVMIVHPGGSQAVTPEHYSFLRMDTETIEYGLDIKPASFQSPAWSPDGSLIALTRSTDNENQVIVTNATGENPEAIGTFTAKTAFAWSFDSTKLAYLDAAQTLSNGTVGAMHVHDIDSGEETVVNKNIVAFFWSPDGKEIAYFILVPIQPSEGDSTSGTTTQQYAVQLSVLDVTSGESRELYTYRPTQQFLGILPYFDQYHQSATIWSPDNNNLVISFVDSEGTSNIAVVAASGNLEPRLLAQGFLAFWSWQ